MLLFFLFDYTVWYPVGCAIWWPCMGYDMRGGYSENEASHNCGVSCRNRHCRDIFLMLFLDSKFEMRFSDLSKIAKIFGKENVWRLKKSDNQKL